MAYGCFIVVDRVDRRIDNTGGDGATCIPRTLATFAGLGLCWEVDGVVGRFE